MFSSLKDWLSGQKEDLSAKVSRFKNRPFMDAAMAGCALVAAADGSIDSDEKQKVAGFIRSNPAMVNFDMGTCITRFNEYAGQLEFDHGVGQVECLKAIRVITDSDRASTLVHLCIAIGAADGDFDSDEQAVVAKIIGELGLNLQDYGLAQTV